MKPDNFQDLQRCVDMCIDEINENLEYTLGKNDQEGFLFSTLCRL